MTTRRRFLGTLTGTAALITNGLAASAAETKAAMPDPHATVRVPWPEGTPVTARTRFVVINDLHATAEETRGVDRIITQLNTEKPAFVVFVGDLNRDQSPARGPHEAAMNALMRITADKATFPCRFGMGNTDMTDGDDPTSVFRKSTGQEPYYQFEQGGVYFFMLYTEAARPARFGIVDRKQLDWLARQLQKIPPEAPIVLFGHHALYDAASKWGKDNWGIENSHELLAVFAGHRLTATFSGHRHLNRMARDRRGVLHVINGAMYRDHSDDLGPKRDGVGYRWVEVEPTGIGTTWVQVGHSPISS